MRKAIAMALSTTRPTLAQFTTTSYIGNKTFVNHISYEAARDAWRATARAVIAAAPSKDAAHPIALGLLEVERERLLRNHFENLPASQSPCPDCRRAHAVKAEIDSLS